MSRTLKFSSKIVEFGVKLKMEVSENTGYVIVKSIFTTWRGGTLEGVIAKTRIAESYGIETLWAWGMRPMYSAARVQLRARLKEAK